MPECSMKRMKHHPQAMLQAGCFIVAIWFLAADLLGADTMPSTIYGNATALAPAWAWAVSIITSTGVYLIGFLFGWTVFNLRGTRKFET